MASSSNLITVVPQFFGENYQIWVVKMKSYLKSMGLWEIVDEDRQVAPLIANPTMAQMKQYQVEKQKRDRAVT